MRHGEAIGDGLMLGSSVLLTIATFGAAAEVSFALAAGRMSLGAFAGRAAIGAASGGILGGGINAAQQTLRNSGPCPDQFDFGEFGSAVAGGAISGAIFGGRGAIGAARRGPSVAKTLGGAVGKEGAGVVREVLKGRQALSALTAEQRSAAAAFYRDVATRTVGREAAAASRYNIARAEFLEGSRSSLSPTLPEFIKNGF